MKSFDEINCFSLLGGGKEPVKAHKAIKKLIEDFAKKYKLLEKKYKRSGIGDTATDEAVANTLYEVIHFDGKIP